MAVANAVTRRSKFGLDERLECPIAEAGTLSTFCLTKLVISEALSQVSCYRIVSEEKLNLELRRRTSPWDETTKLIQYFSFAPHTLGQSQR